MAKSLKAKLSKHENEVINWSLKKYALCTLHLVFNISAKAI